MLHCQVVARKQAFAVARLRSNYPIQLVALSLKTQSTTRVLSELIQTPVIANIH